MKLFIVDVHHGGRYAVIAEIPREAIEKLRGHEDDSKLDNPRTEAWECEEGIEEIPLWS